MDWLVEVTKIEKGKNRRSTSQMYFWSFFNASTELEAKKKAQQMAIKHCRLLFPTDKKWKGWKYRNHKNVHIENIAQMFLRQTGNYSYQVELYKVDILCKKSSGAIEYKKLVEFR